MDWGIAKLLDESEGQPGICEPLAFAYRKGVLHRDQKPRNVLVSAAEEELGTDWGLASLLDKRGDQRRVAGTWPYMPPEQATGRMEEVDRRSDVFGLGAILCAILTGKPPYADPTPEVVMRQAGEADLAGAYTRLEACGADDDLIKLAKRCLAVEPDDRPRDAGKVATAVAKYLADLGERAHKAKVAQAVAGEKIARALTAAISGDLEAAEQAIAEAELDGASTGQVRMLRGQIALHRGQIREAMRHLEQAVQLLPNSVAAQGMLASAYAYDGQWEQYNKSIQQIYELSPSTPEDFLFKGYAEANLDPARGLQTIKQAFDHRPMMGIAPLLRAEVRAFLAQDTDDLGVAEEAVQDAGFARELLGDKNPAALWVSLHAHGAKAGVHEHRGEPEKRRAELELAGKYADALKPFTALPEAVVYRWLYFREMGKEEEILEELRLASERTDHVYVAFCYALTLYRRSKPGDLRDALGVLKRGNRGNWNVCLLPFVLAEHDWRPDKHDWAARARKACEDYSEQSQDGLALMTARTILCLLGETEEAVRASKALQKQPERFYILRREPTLRCLQYNAGALSEGDLIEGAKGSRWDQCLAHYYVAMTKLAKGDRKEAQEHFDKVVKTRAFIWASYDLSCVFQARLANDPTWPPWIPKEQEK
jgi:tetratricopeptide (TPR) repeat protein